MYADLSRKRKKFVCGIILVLMVALALGTVALAAGSRAGGSYSLIIRKVLAPDSPEKAKNQKYTFHIEGTTTVRDDSGNHVEKPMSEEVTITGAGEETLEFDGPTIVSVVELKKNDNLSFESDGEIWHMTTTQCESKMTIPGRNARDITISGSEGRITIARPSRDNDSEYVKATTYFKITGKDFHEDQVIYDQEVSIPYGGSLVLDHLPRGVYSIEELKAPEGFSVTVGKREAEVQGGKTGQIYINGSSGTLKIKAPGKTEDNKTYYYTVMLDGNAYGRAIDIRSGESGELNHLPRGTYTITQYIHGGIEGYSVTVPQTKDDPVNKKLLAKNYTPSSEAQPKRYYFEVKGDYVDTFFYGPLMNSNDERLPETTLYKFAYSGSFVQTDGSVKDLVYTAKECKANKRYSSTKIFDTRKNKKIYFGVQPLTGDVSGSYCSLSWVEHTLLEKEEKNLKPNISYPQTVDERGWMTIAKNGDDNAAAGNVTYYYTVTGKDGMPIENYTVTDKNGNQIPEASVTDKTGTTVMLKAGQTVTLKGLAKGNYSIKETVMTDSEVPFAITVENDEKDTTDSGNIFEVRVFGERQLTISKPAGYDGGRTYEFKLFGDTDDGRHIEESIWLLAGETKNFTVLPAGNYTIQPTNDGNKGFDLTLSDNSSAATINGPASEVTFTNAFSKQDGSYRVIHEYYFKEEDGTYTYEGSGVLNTEAGKAVTDTVFYTSSDVRLIPMYGGNQYTYMGHSYGTGTLIDGTYALRTLPATPANAVQPGKPPHIPDRVEEGTPGNADSSLKPPHTPDDENEKGTPNNADSSDWTLHSIHAFVRRATSSDAMPLALDDYESSFDEDGIIAEGVGIGPEPDSIRYEYQPDITMTEGVNATPDGEQIIIMRYYREEKEIRNGSYKVVHIYYLRDQAGDHWEGSSHIRTVDVGRLTEENRRNTYTADSVTKEPEPKNFFVDGRQYVYTYESPLYGKVVKREDGSTDQQGEYDNGIYTCRPDTKMKEVYATKQGDQIIILRYYRTLGGEERSGSYNVVHEYYYREKETEQDSYMEEDVLSDYTKAGAVENSHALLGWADDMELPAQDDGEASFGGTLVDRDEYVYTFEGMTDMEHILAPLEQRYTKEHVKERPHYTPEGGRETQYTYYNVGYGRKTEDGYVCISDKEWAASTEEGTEVIILRYVRQPGSPDGPGDPDPDPDPDPGPDPDPDPDPEPTPPAPTIPSDPVTPTEPIGELPEYPTELPDPNDPDSPDRITIVKEGVPLTYVKVWDPVTQKWAYILDEDVPTYGLPKTGNSGQKMVFYFLTFAGALGSTVIVRRIQDRRKKEDQQ